MTPYARTRPSPFPTLIGVGKQQRGGFARVRQQNNGERRATHSKRTYLSCGTPARRLAATSLANPHWRGPTASETAGIAR